MYIPYQEDIFVFVLFFSFRPITFEILHTCVSAQKAYATVSHKYFIFGSHIFSFLSFIIT